jgi:hypothetical protein
MENTMTTNTADLANGTGLPEIDDVVYDAVRVECLLSALGDISVMGNEASQRVQTMITLCHGMAKALVIRIDDLPRVKQ